MPKFIAELSTLTTAGLVAPAAPVANLTRLTGRDGFGDFRGVDSDIVRIILLIFGGTLCWELVRMDEQPA